MSWLVQWNQQHDQKSYCLGCEEGRVQGSYWPTSKGQITGLPRLWDAYQWLYVSSCWSLFHPLTTGDRYWCSAVPAFSR